MDAKPTPQDKQEAHRIADAFWQKAVPLNEQIAQALANERRDERKRAVRIAKAWIADHCSFPDCVEGIAREIEGD